MITLILLSALALVNGQVKFEAFDCTNPQEIRMLAHENCEIHSGHTEVKNFVIVQNNPRKNVTGFTCERKQTALVDYCGHYSSTKATGQSTIRIPMVVTESECRNMVTRGEYSADGVTHNVKMNSINHLSWFTHGSVKMDGDNIQCTGEPLRLHNGQVNKNMIRQVIQEITIQQIQLIIENDEVLLQSGEVVGKAKKGVGTVDTKTVIWTSPEPNECKKSVITTMKLTTKDGISYINKDHMIKIDKKSRVYNPQCKITYFETNDENLYLMEENEASKLEMYNKASVLVSSHIQTQLDFLGSRVSTVIKDAYSVSTDPQCHEINWAPLHKTLKLSANKFTRNLGDVSVVFTCSALTVELDSNNTQCYIHPPVLTGESSRRYIDPETRIILTDSVSTSCKRDTSPIIKATNGKFYAISPHAIEIVPDKTSRNADKKGEKTHGLYPLEVVNSWLSNAYLSHIHKSLSINYAWGRIDTEVNTMVNQLTDTYDRIKNMDIKSTLLGIDLDHVGAQCGIASATILAVLIMYWTIELVLKLIMVHDKTKTYKQSLIEAGFGHLTVLAERHKVKEREEDDKQYASLKL